METRQMNAQFKTRAEEDGKYIEGYFAVFDGNYDISDTMSESIDAHAFDEALEDDIRALTNHDTTLVLGRTNAETLKLKVDEHGLFGSILINPNDTDAVNLYERVMRGDVNQCSFGFDILDEETEFLEGDRIHFTIKKVKLYEVSCCTFPAYKDTSITARESYGEKLLTDRRDAWKKGMLQKLKGEN